MRYLTITKVVAINSTKYTVELVYKGREGDELIIAEYSEYIMLESIASGIESGFDTSNSAGRVFMWRVIKE